MIKLANGYQFDFACASGALAYTGDGWWWEQIARWTGFLRPKEFTIITKSLTYQPRVGNLKMWCPWRCVKLLPNGGVINAVGLTNPGIDWWIKKCYSRILKKGYKVIVSIAPENTEQTERMIRKLNNCKEIVGIQLNVSCPNVAKGDIKNIIYNTRVASTVSEHPISLKLGVTYPYVEICKKLEKTVAFFELINTVPWSFMCPDVPSPLAKYGLEGGVSGPPIKQYARKALIDVVQAGIKTPIASGGAIDKASEVYARRILGAKAFIIGSKFLRNILKPNSIIHECREAWKK